MNKESEYIQIDLLKIAQGLIRRFWIIMISMLLCGALLFSYATFLITPLYEASILLYVNNSSFSVGATSFSISSSEISAAKSLVETYQVILKTRMTLNDVIRLGELDYTYEDLCEMIKTESVNETEVFSITVTSDDPHESEHIANTIGRVLPDKISAIVEGSSVRVVDYAVVPAEKVSPSISKYTLIGLMLGMMLSCAVIAIMEIADDSIRSENYLLENFADTPLLAVIPDMLDEKSSGQYYYSSYEKRSGESRTKKKGEPPKKKNAEEPKRKTEAPKRNAEEPKNKPEEEMKVKTGRRREGHEQRNRS